MFPRSSILNPQSRFGGPRYIIRPITEFEPRGPERSAGGGRFNDIQESPSVAAPVVVSIITPEIAAQEVAGGFTPGQIDIAAKAETQEGAPVGIFYGKLLFGARNVVSHKYVVGPPKQNTFTVLFGDGWGDLGRHGDWNRIVKAYYLGEELTKRYDYTVWFDDRLPTVTTLDPGLDGWNWIQTNPNPYIGQYAHQSPVIAGTHYHQFSGATPGLAIGTGDTISCWIWIDPTNPPTEVMLQFWIGGGIDPEHRAYWGANSITLGINGTNSRRQINASIPATGQWVRLDVLASQVGLEGTTVDGMAFLLFGGGATW
ncbi:MAG TPA: hypothetical protein VE715_17935, partial [Blastocatellia bacterium]|nr:hypothetical protein [Blastocatellia bacterium]